MSRWYLKTDPLMVNIRDMVMLCDQGKARENAEYSRTAEIRNEKFL